MMVRGMGIFKEFILTIKKMQGYLKTLLKIEAKANVLTHRTDQRM